MPSRSSRRRWSRVAPSTHERSLMFSRCGRRCFLGTKKSFPICSRHTCKINRSGVLAAYQRAREFVSRRPRSSKYRRISRRALRLLHRRK